MRMIFHLRIYLGKTVKPYVHICSLKNKKENKIIILVGDHLLEPFRALSRYKHYLYVSR